LSYWALWPSSSFFFSTVRRHIGDAEFARLRASCGAGENANIQANSDLGIPHKSLKPRRFGMNDLINFFALRPVFTHYGMKIVWYIYLVNAFVQTYIAVNGVFRILAQRGISWETWSPNFIPLILGIIVQLALVRLLLEVAAVVLSSARRS